MKSAKPVTPFAPFEVRKFILPVSLAAILVLSGMTAEAIYASVPANKFLTYIGITGILYIVICNLLIVRFNNIKLSSYGIINALVTGVGLGFLALKLPKDMIEINHILIVFSAIAIATISNRQYAYLFLGVILAISLPSRLATLINLESVLEYFMPIMVALVALEVIVRLKETANQHMHRLETINKVSRQITQSLDTKQTLALLDATIQDALEADTFFIGILDGDKIDFELFYDDGEYFYDKSAPMQGSLSGWVIKNQKELFLPDMREEVRLDGVKSFIMGKNKTSLSWIGVPLKAENITGVLALASYSANAFDRADLELLINLGQHVTLALDNTIRHAQVEKQTQLDSLTNVYNHGHFLKRLAEQSEESLMTRSPLSLIMLDVDYFKQYNDTYGHLIGDRVLQGLCAAIQQHIKQTDAVGRWGGEEFVISLPRANRKQALQIAKRISKTLKSLQVRDRDHQIVPIPTISQGIAVFPKEADEIFRLIDIADKRLYVAKKRGRNQIEPKTNGLEGQK
ncbi:MAG TPA: sensor domain-containing diguanylate cyclase [Anaerolineales bacterium]|nr:sensor domain-containing diguanylate cyclase [Anaerolineales bacterium]